ncbi:hypothetical protein [Serratia fonticola]|uniref:hypothetical protein n=1 Tax=Serratia fonticola TaxID=47917 RepID=UPI0034C640AF
MESSLIFSSYIALFVAFIGGFFVLLTASYMKEKEVKTIKLESLGSDTFKVLEEIQQQESKIYFNLVALLENPIITHNQVESAVKSCESTNIDLSRDLAIRYSFYANKSKKLFEKILIEHEK